jgi:hypothetical protein
MNEQKTRQVVGLSIIFVFSALAFYAGFERGYSKAQNEMPELAQVNERLQMIEKTVMKSNQCSAIYKNVQAELNASKAQPTINDNDKE